MRTLLLDSRAVDEHASLPAVIDAVADAFGAYERGETVMPAKSYVDLPQYDGDFRSMPAYVDADGWDAAAVKWVNSHPENPARHDLPTVMGTVVYSDPATAFPLAVMDGTTLTARRTGAAAAVATDHLAVPDADSMGLVGAGAQASTQLEAVSVVRDVETVVVADVDEDRVARFVDRFDERFDVRAGSVAEAAACDVVSTTTPVTDPIVERDVVGDRTHVNAMGADAAGKHELADDLLLDAKVVIDDHDQCTHSGEINVPYAAGLLTDDDIHAELGAVVTGRATGRTETDGVTVFDSTGLAIQDVAAAHVAYERAREHGDGEALDLLGLD